MEELKIRRMREEDLNKVLEIENLSFSNPWSRNAFLFELVNRGISYPIIIEKEDKIIGYSIMWIIGEESHITNIAIHPHYRKMGIGKFILEKLITISKKRKAKYISLEVRKSNKNAVMLYEKMEFKLIGIRKNYYTNPLEDALIYLKQI
ncbi:MAG: ribosomal protein S18-alanine N-acetyltransferase [Acidobacteriota bacterium]